MSTESHERYTPQDNNCGRCGFRIGNHTDYNLWKCLDILSKKCESVRRALVE